MLNSFLVIFNKNKKNVNDKVVYTLLLKEQFKYLKTAHSYHLVDPSPWPLIASLGGFMLTSGLVLYMHKFIGGWNLLVTGFLLILYVMYVWWRDSAKNERDIGVKFLKNGRNYIHEICLLGAFCGQLTRTSFLTEPVLHQPCKSSEVTIMSM